MPNFRAEYVSGGGIGVHACSTSPKLEFSGRIHFSLFFFVAGALVCQV